MKFKIVFLIAFILITLSLISCFYPGDYYLHNDNYSPDDNYSLSTDNSNLEATIFLRYTVRDYPIRKTKDSNIYWDCSVNEFGDFSPNKNGYHSGEDWNLVGGEKGPNEDLGKPVFAIGKGKIIATNKVGKNGSLGYIVVIEHIGSFKIPAWEMKDNQGNIASYSAEKDVNKFYSVYLHLDNVQIKENEEKTACETLVDENTILGYIMDPGEGPHLHFEIRKTIDKHSSDWSLAGNSDNWQYTLETDPKNPNKNIKIYNGYYINLQEMINAELRDPSEFIDANSSIIDMIKKIQGNNK